MIYNWKKIESFELVSKIQSYILYILSYDVFKIKCKSISCISWCNTTMWKEFILKLLKMYQISRHVLDILATFVNCINWTLSNHILPIVLVFFLSLENFLSFQVFFLSCTLQLWAVVICITTFSELLYSEKMHSIS